MYDKIVCLRCRYALTPGSIIDARECIGCPDNDEAERELAEFTPSQSNPEKEPIRQQPVRWRGKDRRNER